MWNYRKISNTDYYITNDGLVISNKAKLLRVIKPFTSVHGYSHTVLDGKYYSIHRLVGSYFINNDLNKPEINHKDGNKLNNNVDNLEWCTRSENMKHLSETKNSSGCKNNNSKLTSLDVEMIRNSNLTNTALAKQLNVSRQAVGMIRSGKRWSS